MKNKLLFVLLLSIISQLIIYREFFFSGKVPFSANLLVSFYTPWNSTAIPGWEHGIPNKPLGHDGIRFFFPIKKNIIDSVRRDVFPLWNPYILGGTPLMANLQSSFFYPTTFLYLMLPLIDAWSIQVVLTPVLSILFMYLYLNRIKLQFSVSVLISFLWAYSGFFAVWAQENPAVIQSEIWLPFVLYTLERFISNKNFNDLIIACLGMTLSLLGGHIQFSLYIFIFSAIYLFARLNFTLIKKLKYLMLFLFIPVIVSAVQLIPSFEAFIMSARDYENSRHLFDTYLLPLTHLVNTVAPDWKGNPATYNYFDNGSYYDQIIYIGLIPLILSIVGSFAFKTNNLVRIHLLTVMMSFWLSFSNSISQFIFNKPIPFFSSVIPSRLLSLTSFSLVILCGFGIKKILEEKSSLKQLLTALFFPFTFLLIGWIYFLQNKDQGIMATKALFSLTMLKNLLLPTVIFFSSIPLFFVVSRKGELKRISLWVMLIIIVVHQYYFYAKNTYFSERQFVFPDQYIFSYLSKINDGYYRFSGLGRAEIKPNVASFFGLYSPEGLDPMLSGSYARVAWGIHSAQVGRKVSPLIEVSFSELFPEKSFISGTEPIFSFFQRAGVKYLITHKQDAYSLNPSYFKPIYSSDPFTISEMPILPRVFLTQKYQLLTSKSTPIIDVYKTGNKQVFLEKNPNLAINEACNRPSEGYFENYQATKVKIRTRSECNSLLYLSDSYYPGWHATIDGIEHSILRANLTFRALEVPAGTHIVQFEYRPFSFIAGLASSTLGVFGVILLVLLNNAKKIQI